IDREGELQTGIPVLNPLARPLAYRFPVHRISPDYQPETAPEQATYLVVYRNSRDQVSFIELNPVSAKLVELIQSETNHNCRELLQMIAAELQHPNPDTVIQGGLEILNDMRDREVILGTRKQ
ncbi:MAG: hypothetical protein MI673_08335, partial [Thiotrichales bacterium]|nr:hypothetical protein [Thiotrichales bacterium]